MKHSLTTTDLREYRDIPREIALSVKAAKEMGEDIERRKQHLLELKDEIAQLRLRRIELRRRGAYTY